jgi:hypothetical protein
MCMYFFALYSLSYPLSLPPPPTLCQPSPWGLFQDTKTSRAQNHRESKTESFASTSLCIVVKSAS